MHVAEKCVVTAHSPPSPEQLTADQPSCLACSRPELLKGVYAMGFNAPSKIQEMALPILLADP